MTTGKTSMYIAMSLLVFSWGLEFVFAKQALSVMEPLTLTFFKYLIAFIIVTVIKLKMEPGTFINKQDFPILAVCSGFGVVGYFFCEYKAMDYMPLSLLTIILAFVPVFSILMERLIYKAVITRPMVGGSVFCTIGVCFVIGADFQVLFQGRILGYLLAFLAIVCWNAYNFTTAYLNGRYSSITLTFNQQLVSLILLLPFALASLPDPSSFTPAIVGSVVYLGAMGGVVGYIIMVRALKVIGVTPTAIFSNFMPVTTTLFGWVILGETVSPVQLAGGAVIIVAGCLVIWEKQKASLAARRETESSESLK